MVPIDPSHLEQEPKKDILTSNTQTAKYSNTKIKMVELHHIKMVIITSISDVILHVSKLHFHPTYLHHMFYFIAHFV